MKIRRLWQWILAASGVVGSLFVIIDQQQRIAGWIGGAAGVSSEWAASVYYGIGSVQRRAAARIAETYHANPVCIARVASADLDGDSYATDLIAKYIDLASLAESDPPLTCDDYADATFGVTRHERFMVAKGSGFSHQVLASFTAFNEVRALGGLVIGTYFDTDFPNSTIYGYQGGSLAEIQYFDHMLEYGTGDDEEVSAFNLIATDKGIRVRAPAGLFDILWNDQNQAYAVTHLDWNAVIANNQYVLYVQRPLDGAETDAILLRNGEKLAGAEDIGRTVTTYVSPLDRIVFDPLCLVKDGFKDVENALGAVALDSATKDHIFECVLYPGAIVTVRVEIL